MTTSWNDPADRSGSLAPWARADAVGIEPETAETWSRLAAEADRHMDALERTRPVREGSVLDQLRRRGITRRDFLKWATATTALLALPPEFTGRVARAAQLATRVPVVWQELQSCAGNSEALIRSANPGIEEVLLDMISLEYSELLMAASGERAEAHKADVIERYRGQYVAVFEGSVPTGLDGGYLTVGGHTGPELVREVASNAQLILNAGTCSSYGGIPQARPNPTGALGVPDFLAAEGIATGVPVVNLPACPVNAVTMVGTVLEVVMFGRIPRLDAYGRPVWAYGVRIHDRCERRGHFDAGEFVEGWADIEGLKRGYCLYKVGCKGPYTYNNCSSVRYNDGTSWPVMSGVGCIGCSEPSFWDTMTPFPEELAEARYTVPGFGDATADRIGLYALGAAAVGIAAHAVLTGVRMATESKGTPPDTAAATGSEEEEHRG